MAYTVVVLMLICECDWRSQYLFSLCTSHHRFVLTTKVSETLRRLSFTDIGQPCSTVVFLCQCMIRWTAN